jgi:hypothetical protein
MRPVTFFELLSAMQPLHQGNRADIDTLHDVWKSGAWTPDSYVLPNAKFDERLESQKGAHVRRVLMVGRLATWIMEIAGRRGFPITRDEAMRIAAGQGFNPPSNL